MITKPSLLVADDEIEIGEIVKAVAEGLGFEVTCVEEGSTVVGLVDRIKPDVIANIMNLQMLYLHDNTRKANKAYSVISQCDHIKYIYYKNKQNNKNKFL